MQEQLTKIEQRLDGLDRCFSEIDTKYQLAVQSNGFISAQLEDIKKLIKENTVSREEFKPVRTIVYGMVGIIITAFLVAVVALVIPKVTTPH